jgi:EAL domain-containing protein (putative c-di-GMP-specific phosphodiesterase class I)/GGDEF domain-containing protein
MLYNEMVNNEHSNKLLSETIEQQMLLNSIYSKVLNERNSMETMQTIVNMTGDFLKLDRVIVCEDTQNSKKYRQIYEWVSIGADVMGKRSKLSEFTYDEYPVLLEELKQYETYFSNNPEHDIFGLEFSSYVASNLIGDGLKYGMIIYLINDKDRILTPAEKRLLRSVSQIIAAVIMRCKDNETLDMRNERLRYLAYHCQVLGVKNRASLDVDASAVLAKGYQGAIVAFKFPNIRNINNFVGAERTEGLVMKVLEYIFNYRDLSAEPYRFSDKIFMVLLRDADQEGTNKFCETILQRFDKTWIADDGSEHTLEIILGAAPFPESGTTTDELCQAAIMAMYKAFEYGTNKYAFFTDDFENPAIDSYNCTQILRNALNNNMEGLLMRYIPIYCADSMDGRVISCEATPVIIGSENESEYENSYSSQLILQNAERMGIDVVINAWVINKACEFCQKARALKPDLVVSVNATSRALATGAIVAITEKALEQTGLDPSGLTIQFSERIIASNYEKFLSTLSELRKTGVSIALSNLGSYYNPVSLLRHSGINEASADITIFTGQVDELDAAYVSSVVKLAKENSIKIGVKSIDKEEQLDSIPAADWFQTGGCSSGVSDEVFFDLL